MFGAASGDLRGDAQLTDPAAVGVVVVSAVGVHRLRAPSRPAALAADRRGGLDQRDQLGDVVAVAAGGGGGERNAVGLDDHGACCRSCPGPPGAGRSSPRPSWPAHASRRPRRGRSPAGPRPAARPAAPRAGAARPRPRSSPAAAASRSCPSRSPAPAARTPSGSRCRARTGCPACAPGHDRHWAPVTGRSSSP